MSTVNKRRDVMMNTRYVGFYLLEETIEKIDQVIEKKMLPGVRSRSGVVEYALDKLFKEIFGDEKNG